MHDAISRTPAAPAVSNGVVVEAGERSVERKTVRALIAADGFLQLELPDQALAEVEALGDAGPLESARLYLVGQCLMGLGRFDDAIEPLRAAAGTIPAPWDGQAWEALSVCFRECGQPELAAVTDLWAEDRGYPEDLDESAAEELRESAEAFVQTVTAPDGVAGDGWGRGGSDGAKTDCR